MRHWKCRWTWRLYLVWFKIALGFVWLGGFQRGNKKKKKKSTKKGKGKKFIGVFGWVSLWKENWWGLSVFLPNWGENWRENIDANQRPIFPSPLCLSILFMCWVTWVMFSLFLFFNVLTFNQIVAFVFLFLFFAFFLF